MSRTLHPGSNVGHYHVISALGAGGMGEVYLAQDSKLERRIALKVLPQEVVKNEERLRRFVQEARAASSLNHPHIVTIYEIGQAEVRDEDGQGPSGAPLNYIAMELVAGRTLRDEIHDARTDLRTLLRYLAQAAEGLAKAHAAGIVHRDLKPDNVMIASDGYAKVLDFGLAKLTELQGKAGDDGTSESRTPTRTVEGTILGTVGYMAPEQVRGRPVDHRADIFSLGCLLYEAATRRRPFMADSDVETMHQILNVNPPSVDEVNPDVPAELRRLIRRCLAKNPEQRLQSMKDLAIELREIVDEFDSLSTSASSQVSIAGAGAGLPAATRVARWPLWAGFGAAILVGVAGLSFGMWAWTRGGEAKGPATAAAPFQSMRLTPLTSSGNLAGAALSPDGRLLAYLVDRRNRRSLRVKQIATGSDVEIAPAQEPDAFRSLSFSADGDYLYYLGRDQENRQYSSLYRVPSLGGAATRILFDVDSGVAVSPDGTRLAFSRGYPQRGESALLVANADGSGERELATIVQPDVLIYATPSWSADGQRIATAVRRLLGGFREDVVVFDAASGEPETVAGRSFVNVRSVTWLPGDRSLLVAAVAFSDPTAMQVWRLSYPDGVPRRVTNDLDDYFDLSVSRDGTSLTAIASRREAGLHVFPAAGGEGRPVSSGSTIENAVDSFVPLPDGSIAFAAMTDRFLQIWTITRDGTRRQLTTGNSFNFGPRAAPGSGDIVFNSAGRDVVVHLWRLASDGGSPVQLTDGGGEILLDVAPDGSTALFSPMDAPQEIWSVPTDGGEPRRIASGSPGSIGFSRDSKHVAYVVLERQDERLVTAIEVVPAEGGEPTKRRVLPPDGFNVGWGPGDDELTFVRQLAGAGNLWTVGFENGEPRQITQFADGRIAAWRWSPDRAVVVVNRILDETGNLWSVGAEGGEPRQLTDFASGQIFDFQWSADGRELVVSQGEINPDAVLITDFR